MIPTTKPFLPPLKEYNRYTKDIWTRNWLTNNGPLLNELELSLANYLNLNEAILVSNGTIALQIAIKALGLHGEIITTPYSYVATTSSIVWEGCKPVFVDITEADLNLNPALLEKAITPQTTAILATHVYGNPCDIQAIEAIATKHKLAVIYDAAHCFGTTYLDKSIYQFGDISTASFHATKIFHTVEGGGVFARKQALVDKVKRLRNFGHTNQNEFDGPGINGKNSEFHAAMGLCVLPYMDEILERRKSQWIHYIQLIQGINLRTIQINAQTSQFNYAYFPVIFPTPEKMHRAKESLELHNVFPRRYFSPALNTLNYVSQTPCPIAESISERVLTLPLFHELKKEDQEMIARILSSI